MAPALGMRLLRDSGVDALSLVPLIGHAQPRRDADLHAAWRGGYNQGCGEARMMV